MSCMLGEDEGWDLGKRLAARESGGPRWKGGIAAFQAAWRWGVGYPGRCPGLRNCGPLGLGAVCVSCVLGEGEG